MEFIKEPKNVEDLYPLVVKECELIKEHFPEVKQLLELDIKEFDTTYKTSCVYGKMTGNCNDERVRQFIEQHLEVVIKSMSSFQERDERTVKYMTPLEVYIYGYEGEYDEEDNKGNIDFDEEAKERLEKVLELLK